jgi:hypothetical protein
VNSLRAYKKAAKSGLSNACDNLPTLITFLG